MMRRIPALLIAFRAVAALAVLPLGWLGQGAALAILILLATLSDVFDGIIARRAGVSTVTLRRADSIVDLIFWLCATAALCLLRPGAMAANAPVLTLAIGAEILLQGISLFRFRRLTATHARSAKFFGLCLLVGFVMVALGGNSALAFWIVGAGAAVSALDGLAILLLLRKWEADIPSAWAAWQLRQGKAVTRHWLG
jgi:CDP-diacylglycerol--glycerol-3-phosphate 3-phosphatidyltransferase